MAINIKNLSEQDNKQNILSNAKFEEETLILKRAMEQGEGGPLGDYVKKSAEKYKKDGLTGDDLYRAVAFDLTMEGTMDPVSAFPAIAKQLNDEMAQVSVDEEIQVLREHSPQLFEEFSEEQVEAILKKTKQYEDVFPQKQSLLERLKEGAKNPETQRNLLKYGSTALMAASLIGTGGASAPAIVASRLAVKVAPMIGEQANKLINEGCKFLVDKGVMSQEAYDSGKQKLDEMTEKATSGRIGKYAKAAGLVALGVGAAVGVSAGVDSISPETLGNTLSSITDPIADTARTVGEVGLSEAAETLDSLEGASEWLEGRIDSTFDTAADLRDFISSEMMEQAMELSQGLDNPEGFVENLKVFAASGLFTGSDFIYTHIGAASDFAEESIYQAIHAVDGGREFVEQKVAGWGEALGPDNVAEKTTQPTSPDFRADGNESYGVLKSDGLNYSATPDVSSTPTATSTELPSGGNHQPLGPDAVSTAPSEPQGLNEATATPEVEPNIYTVVENDDLSSVIFAELESKGMVGDKIVEHLYSDYDGGGSLVEQIAKQNPDVFEIGANGELTVHDIYPGEKINLSLLDNYDPNIGEPLPSAPAVDTVADPAPATSPDITADSARVTDHLSVFDYTDADGKFDLNGFLQDSGIDAGQLPEGALAEVQSNPQSVMDHISANGGKLNLSEFLTANGYPATTAEATAGIGGGGNYDGFSGASSTGTTDLSETSIGKPSEATLPEGQHPTAAENYQHVADTKPGDAALSGYSNDLLSAHVGGSSMESNNAASIIEQDIGKDMAGHASATHVAATPTGAELESGREAELKAPEETEEEKYDSSCNP